MAQYLHSCAENPEEHTPELFLDLLSAYLAIRQDTGELKHKESGSDDVKMFDYPGSREPIRATGAKTGSQTSKIEAKEP